MHGPALAAPGAATMGQPPQEVRRLAETLEREVGLALTDLAASEKAEHRRRMLRQLDGLLGDAVMRLPPALVAVHLLRVGQDLEKAGCFSEAVDVAYRRLTPLCTQVPASAEPLDHLRAKLGIARCATRVALQADQRLAGAHTLRLVLSTAGDVCHVLCAALQHPTTAETLRTALEATSVLASLTCQLIQSGLYKESLPLASAASAALEAHPTLNSLPELLQWRCTLYTITAHASAGVLLMLGADDRAAAAAAAVEEQRNQTARFLQHGMEQIDSLLAALRLDPIPQPAGVLQQLHGTRARLSLLATLFMPVVQPSNTLAGVTSRSAEAQVSTPTDAASVLRILAPLGQAPQQLAALLDLLQCGLARGSGAALALDRVDPPAALMPALDAATELARCVFAGAKAGACCVDQQGSFGAGSYTLNEQQYVMLLRVAYTFGRQELFAATAAITAAKMPDGEQTGTAAAKFSVSAAAASVLEAMQRLQDGSSSTAGADTLAHALRQHSAQLRDLLPGGLAAAAAALAGASAHLLRGCFACTDSDAPRTQLVLEGLHAALCACDHGDGMLRGSVAVRLSLLLLEQQQLTEAAAVVEQVRAKQKAAAARLLPYMYTQACCSLDSATRWTVAHCTPQGIAAIEAARITAMLQLHGAPDEHLRWVSAERTQPEPAMTAALAGAALLLRVQ
jgi:hypothetical protein